MTHANMPRAILGGFIATLVLTILFYVVPPKMDIAAMVGSLFGHGTTASMSGLWWTGMIVHFLVGTFVLSLLYASLVYGWLPGANWLRGMIWGLLVWIAAEVILMPMVGSGVFSDHATDPVRRVIVSLIAYAIYGVVQGAIAGTQSEHPRHVAHPA